MTPEEKRQFIKEFGITAELFDEMYAECLEELRQRYGEFQTALAVADVAALRAAAHAMKGVAGNFRLHGVQGAAAALNEYLKAGGPLSGMGGLAEDLAAAMEAIGVEHQ